MNKLSRNYRLVLVLILGLFISLPSFAAESDIDKPVVVINTFDVQGDAEGFFTLMEQARDIAKKLNPKGQGKTRILSGNVEGEYANLITVATTYPNLDAYAEAYDAYNDNPELEKMRIRLDEAGYKVVHRSINTVVAEY